MLNYLIKYFVIYILINNVLSENVSSDGCYVCTVQNNNISTELSKLRSHLNYVFDNIYIETNVNPTGPQENVLIQGRGRKAEPWMLIVPLLIGFHFSGIIAVASHVIKLFIVQAFFASKISIIIGSYVVLKKLLQLYSTKTKHNHKLVIDEHQANHLAAAPPISLHSYHAAFNADHGDHSAGSSPDISSHSISSSDHQNHEIKSYSSSPYNYVSTSYSGDESGGSAQSSGNGVNYEQTQSILTQEYSVHEPPHHEQYSLHQQPKVHEQIGQYSNINVTSVPYPNHQKIISPIHVVDSGPGNSILSRPSLKRRYSRY